MIVCAGLAGAFIVAVTFLVIDLASGRPALWTPAVLGSALFLGESAGQDSAVRPLQMLPVVFGYTLVHGFAFLAFASSASAGRLTRFDRTPMTPPVAIKTAVLMFVGLEVFFIGMGWLFGSGFDLVNRLGFSWVALANALAAIGMTETIRRMSRRLRSRIVGAE
jgi:hypothetical protein